MSQNQVMIDISVVKMKQTKWLFVITIFVLDQYLIPYKINKHFTTFLGWLALASRLKLKPMFKWYQASHIDFQWFYAVI